MTYADFVKDQQARNVVLGSIRKAASYVDPGTGLSIEPRPVDKSTRIQQMLELGRTDLGKWMHVAEMKKTASPAPPRYANNNPVVPDQPAATPKAPAPAPAAAEPQAPAPAPATPVPVQAPAAAPATTTPAQSWRQALANKINPGMVENTVGEAASKLNDAWRDATGKLGQGGEWLYNNTGKVGFGLLGWLLGQRMAGRGKGREGFLRRLLGGAGGAAAGVLGSYLWDQYRPSGGDQKLDAGELAGQAAGGLKNWLAGGK